MLSNIGMHCWSEPTTRKGTMASLQSSKLLYEFLPTLSQRFTRRWINDCCTFLANEIKPSVNFSSVPFTPETRRCHMFNWRVSKHVIPYVDIGQHSLEGLRLVKITTDRVLLLPQRQSAPLSYCVTALEVWTLLYEVPIFVEFPWTRIAFPRKTDVVPYPIKSCYRSFPVDKHSIKIPYIAGWLFIVYQSVTERHKVCYISSPIKLRVLF